MSRTKTLPVETNEPPPTLESVLDSVVAAEKADADAKTQAEAKAKADWDSLVDRAVAGKLLPTDAADIPGILKVHGKTIEQFRDRCARRRRPAAPGRDADPRRTGGPTGRGR